MRIPGPVTVAAAAALLLAGCAPAAGGPPAASQAPQPAVQPQAPAPPAPKRGGLLQWAPIKPGQTLHPHQGSSQDTQRHAGPGYETLVSYRYEPAKDSRETMEIVPWLAESWQQPDDLTYIFKIRTGIKWHDGVDFTAADVAFTYNWLRQEKLAASARTAAAETIEATGPYALKITLKRPTPDFLNELADTTNMIVAKHVVERGDDLRKVLIGTGPFKLKSFRSGVETLWDRFDGYWQPGKPYMDGVRQVWGLEESGMLAAFVAGENDALVTVELAQLEVIRKAKPDAGFYTKANDNGIGLFVKLDRPPFDDVRVRRAIHLAVDREAMNQTLTQGRGVYVAPGVWAGRQGWAIPQEELKKLPGFRSPKDQDLAEAKRLLAEAGYAQGVTFEFMYNAGGLAPPRIAEVLAAPLRSIGVTANLRPLESGVYNATQLGTGQYGGYEGGDLPTVVSAEFRGLYDYFHSKGPYNRTGLSDPKLDALIEATLSGRDEGARKKAAREMQEYLLAQMYYIPTTELVNAALWQPWVASGINHKGSSGLALAQESLSWMWLDVDRMPAARR